MLTEGDQQLINSLRMQPMTITALVDSMGVTANAIRQRLVRLMSSGLICRQKSSEGRGRPSHTYLLTEEGRRSCGNNFSDLAKVLWQEIHAIEDVSVRQKVLKAATERLASTYALEVSGDTLEERLGLVRKFFTDRSVPINVDTSGQLPVVQVLECPYPDLEDDDHHFCEVEKRMFATALGSPVNLCQCRKNGDRCCSFEAIKQA